MLNIESLLLKNLKKLNYGSGLQLLPFTNGITNMTNSTDKKEKKVKKKGPIRFEAIIPISIILVLTGLYFHFFFDSHLKAGLEWTGTQIHGAEVNIKSIKTSFFRAHFRLDGLQVTDKEQPEQNLVELESIRFGMLWDALLRAKVVINEAALENIQIYTKRDSPGEVLPKPTEEEAKNSIVAKSQKAILDQAKADYDQNILGDVANLLGGGGSSKDQLKKYSRSTSGRKENRSINH